MLENLSLVLSEAIQAGPNVYLRGAPEVFDFTDPDARPELTLMGMGGNVVTVAITPQNVFMLFGILGVALKGMKVIVWDWKNLASYLKAATGRAFGLEATLIDLKVLEAYAGLKAKSPETLAGALNRVKTLVQTGVWKDIQPVYQKILLPLVGVVVPAMETAGLLDFEAVKKVHANYEVAGQENGRMRCEGAFRHSFLPHNLDAAAKKRLKPRSLEELFVCFDFRNYEVSVLQHLSGDEKLGELLAGEDPYSAIYEAVTGIAGDPDSRKKAKKMFLPVIYGAGASRLATSLGVALPTAEQIVGRIHGLFPVALRWVESYQQQARESGSAKDIFGKRRFFPPGEEYLARNFSIQAPGSTICLEKLVRLHEALKGVTDIAYNTHDGYCVFANKSNWKEVFQKGHAALTGDSLISPGLRLKVACQAGRNLDGLKPLAIRTHRVELCQTRQD